MLLYTIIFSILIGLIYISQYNSFLFSNKLYDSFILVIPLILYFTYSNIFNNKNDNSIFKYLPILLIFISISTIIWYFLYYNSILNYVIWGFTLLLSLIVIIGLGLVFIIFGNYLKTFNGLTGDIINFIFYIPCLFNDIIEYILNDWKTTTSTVIVLFIIELLLIISYISVPWLMTKYVLRNSISILDDTIFLDNMSIIPMHENSIIQKSVSNNMNDNKIYRRNYGISLWLYLNKHGTNHSAYVNETEIFNYGNGKPKITYRYDKKDKYKKDKLIFYFTNIENNENNLDEDVKTYYELTLPSQKWNHIFFNYHSNYVELFINGNLERSYKFKNNSPNYSSNDTITLGSNDDLKGAITNVKYYKNTLDINQIINIYNLYVNKNPSI
tara:strand:- start:3200 stop:4354 length:1155 start_codon:yes stop_codon:yes gene_type:complete